MQRKRQTQSRQHARSGAAVVECAICVPVILLLFLGAIESCNMIQLKQTLSVSSYEGIRKAIQQNATNSLTLDRCNQILASRKVVNPTITLDPADVSAVVAGTQINVTVSAPCADNSVHPLNFFGGRSMSVTATMVKE